MSDSAKPGDSAKPREEPGRRDVRREIMADLRPVRPLAAPWKRAVGATVPWAIAGTVLVWFGVGLRPDFESLGPLAGFGVSGALLIAAWALAWLAARASVPGLYVPTSLALAAVALLVAARVGAASGIDASRAFPTEEGQGLKIALVCSGAVIAFALPWAIALFVTVRGGLTTRMGVAAVLGGVSAAIAGDALWRLHCPYTSPAHVIGGHVTPWLLLAIVWLFLSARSAHRRGR